MRRLFTVSIGLLAAWVLVAPLSADDQAARPSARPAQASAQFNPKDFSGIWGRFGPPRGNAQTTGAGLANRGDDGFGPDVPPLTPEGQKKFDSYKPGYGAVLGTPGTDHIGRRRAVPPEQQNDPASTCEPYGLTRLILTTYFATIEFVHTEDRIIQNFAWTKDSRNIWMDGRQLPTEVDLPLFNGYSVGRWEGNTLVVNSIGFDDRSWLDRYGYPHSDQMRLEERYTRVAPDRLELQMTLTDPVIYTKPWVASRKAFRLLPRSESTTNGWFELQEERCLPSEEADFNANVRAPR